jgi:hypothetical protein
MNNDVRVALMTCNKEVGKVAVEFDAVEACAYRCEVLGEGALTRTDLKEMIACLRRNRIDDALDNRLVVQEILAEAFSRHVIEAVIELACRRISHKLGIFVCLDSVVSHSARLPMGSHTTRRFDRVREAAAARRTFAC